MSTAPPILRLPSRRAPTAPQAEPATDHFHFVWRVGGRRPTRRHATATAALAEAERLNKLHPAEVFYVYEARALDAARE